MRPISLITVFFTNGASRPFSAVLATPHSPTIMYLRNVFSQVLAQNTGFLAFYAVIMQYLYDCEVHVDLLYVVHIFTVQLYRNIAKQRVQWQVYFIGFVNVNAFLVSFFLRAHE